MRREGRHGLRMRNVVGSSGSVSGCVGAGIFFQVGVDRIASFVSGLAGFQAGLGAGQVSSSVNGYGLIADACFAPVMYVCELERRPGFPHLH